MAELDLAAITERMQRYYEADGSTMEYLYLARVSAADVPALLAEVERLRELTGTCSCGTSPMTYEGPEPDCAVHGAVRALNEASAEVERLRAGLKAIKGNRLVAAVFGHHKGAPRPFALYRHEDETGISGKGVVATGVEFEDGLVVLRWSSAWPTSVVFHERGMESVEAIHGHGGKTTVVWLSDELEPLAETEQKLDVALTEVRLVGEMEAVRAYAQNVRDQAEAERDEALADARRLRAEDRSWADTLMEQRDAAIIERDRLRARLKTVRLALFSGGGEVDDGGG
jgi:hypothetical protein